MSVSRAIRGGSAFWWCAFLVLCSLAEARTPFPSAEHAIPSSESGFVVFPQDTTRPSHRLSRRAMALQKKFGARDTAKARADSVMLQTLAQAPRDSSARLAIFDRIRHDPAQVNPMMPSTYPLYLKAPPEIKYVEQLDTADYHYTIRRLVGGVDTKIPLDFTFEQYRALRMKRAIRENWEGLAHAYELEGTQKKGLSDVFGSITNIEIPVPKNPLFSIFGKNQIKIQINGSVDIHGAFRNTKTDLVTANPLDQSRNEPDFNQQVRVGVRGEIGDKLKIDADWDTQRTFEYENQLKVHYTGYEDEIVQSVEAGNVSLQTNSSFISPSAALFGIKAGMQFGPLKLTTIASQKRGQIRELSVSGGGRPTSFERKPYEYSRDHFFVDTLYRSIYRQAFTTRPLTYDPNQQIFDMEVWVSRTGIIQNPNDRDAVAFMSRDSVLAIQNNPVARAQDYTSIPGQIENGRFMKLTQGVDYTYDQFLGYISLSRSLQPEQIIAVAYTLRGGDVGTFEAKDTSTTSKLILKLVRPKNLQPNMKPAWDLMLKNIYPLGGRGLKKEGFKLGIQYQVSGQEPVEQVTVSAAGQQKEFNLLQMLQLDTFDSNGEKKPDNVFDFDPGITIDVDRGELIFPTLEPFADNIRSFFLDQFKPSGPTATAAVLAAADSFVIREVYDTTYNGAQNSQKNRFTISGITVSSVASTYSLGFNVVEGSVQVIVDGVPAVLNNDYTVDYLSGTVTIRNQSLLVPGKNVQIKYEANDLFQLASKSLLGARGELSLAKNTALGFTIMNLNQQTLSDKVRLGEEPISNTIMGFDGGTRMDLDFVTRAMNWLPGVKTNAPSTMMIKGEAAYMSPDPNTRKSNIAQDNQKSIAYIDDFEGSRRTIPLGINYAIWHDASPPVYIEGLDPYQPVNGYVDLNNATVRASLIPDSLKMNFKSKMTWFNVQPSDVFVKDIWPQRETRAGQDLVTVMDLYYKPKMRGAFNYSMNLQDSLFAQPQKGWAGVMHLLSTTATNLLDENITYIEMWIQIDKTRPTAKLNINLGSISEDVIPNRILNSEDGLGGTIKTGLIRDNKQDVGLDMLSNAEEASAFSAFIAAYPQYASDPSGDDYHPEIRQSLNPDDYLGARGTDGNYRDQSEGGRFPDTEDLNANNVVDRTNSYFEYELSLDTASTGFKQYVTGGGAHGWYQIRIPIKEFTRKIGDPSLTNIESIRMWMTGADDDILVRLTEFNLVGNQWEALDKSDPNFRVSNVSIEENPEYSSPPGVQRPVDRSQPNQIISGNEQSLALIVDHMMDGQSKQAIKRLSSRPLDLFSYRTMKLFVHGDERPLYQMHYVDTTNYDVSFFFRFGTDSLNYYEYRAPLRPGWAPDNEITIRFSDITALKLGRDSANVVTKPIPVPGGAVGAEYRVLGNPTLTNVRYLAVGVENPPGKGSTDVTGEVWVNELRLTDVDDTHGWAYRFDTNLKLADIATLSFGLSQRDPFFHGLEDRFGTRNTDRNWTLNSSFALARLLPDSWGGSAINFSYSHVETMQNPRYVPGTDILVSEAETRSAELAREQGQTEQQAQQVADAVREQSRSLSVTETYALPGVRLSIPSDSWLVTETINRMSFGYSYTDTKRRSPTTAFFEQWGWNFQFGYGLQFSKNNFVVPFEDLSTFFLFSPWKTLKLYFLPQSFNFSTTFSRARTRERARNQSVNKPVARSFASTRQMNFSWQLIDGGFINPSIDYSVSVSSSLVHLELDKYGHQRSLGAILREMIGGSKIFDFGIDLNYSQTISLSTRLVVPKVLKMDQIFVPNFRYNAQYNWQNSLAAGALGKSAGTNANITAGVDINLKTIADALWSPQRAFVPQVVDSTGAKQGPSLAERVDQLSRVLFKVPFFDWDRLSVSFTQANSIRNSGVIGATGFLNVFGRVPFAQSSLETNGPSLLYQLGLASDPNGKVVLGTKSAFPFITGHTVPGLRAPNGNLTDIFGQTNNFTMRTSRSLWEGATLQLTWTLGWSTTLNRTIRTDSLGVPEEISRTMSGDVNRSFLTFPNSFIFKLFKTGLDDVNKRFVEFKSNHLDTRSDDEKIVQAFEEGMEALPISTKLFSSLMPRPNWSLHWDGLEKLPIFSGFASKVSLDHSYTSGFRRRWRLTPTGGEVTESEEVSYAFSPLIGLGITFKNIGKGNLRGNFRYGTATTTNLAPAVQNVTETNTTDITLTASYSRTGFEFPFFGLSLSNDLDVSFSYSYSKNNRRVFDFKKAYKADGDPLEGTVRTVIEPRIRYILSARVTASIYYKYTKLKPDAGGSRIPGSTINEGGLDLRVQIQ